MTLSKAALALAAGWVLCAGSVIGQEAIQTAPYYRLTLRPTPEYANQDEDSQPSPSDIVPQPPAPELSQEDMVDVTKYDVTKSNGCAS